MATENSTAAAGTRTDRTLGQRFALSDAPGGDADRIELRGTLASFAARGIAVDAAFIVPTAMESAVEVDGADGHRWMIWGEDPFGMYASRPRTPAERERWIDRRYATRVSSFFSEDRAHACAMIASEMDSMATELTRKPRRGAGVRIQNKLATMAYVLRYLTTNPDAEMSEARAWLAHVGMLLPQLEVH